MKRRGRTHTASTQCWHSCIHGVLHSHPPRRTSKKRAFSSCDNMSQIIAFSLSLSSSWHWQSICTDNCLCTEFVFCSCTPVVTKHLCEAVDLGRNC